MFHIQLYRIDENMLYLQEKITDKEGAGRQKEIELYQPMRNLGYFFGIRKFRLF